MSENATVEIFRDRTGLVGALGLALVVGTVAFLFSSYFITVPRQSLILFQFGVTWAIYGLLVLGINLQFGYTGIVNFGYLVFFLVGGYAFALVTAGPQNLGTGLGLSWPVGVLASLVLTVVLGVAFGILALRLRGDFLAVVTLAALEVGVDVIRNFPEITGGGSGLYGLPRLLTDATGNYHTRLVGTFVVAVGFLLVTYTIVQRLSVGPYGRVLRSIRSNELVAKSLGKRSFRYKLQVFLIGAVIAAVAGVLMATHFGSVTPDLFGLRPTLIIWIGLLIGGTGNHRAVLAGVAIMMGVELALQYLADYGSHLAATYQFGALQQVIVGLVLVLVIRYRPQGIWGDADRFDVKE